MKEMQFRHEYKHYLNYGDYLVNRKRLAAVMKRDPHAGTEGIYQIRSLYFDTSDDKALQEKINGFSEREKFRIRCYCASSEDCPPIPPDTAKAKPDSAACMESRNSLLFADWHMHPDVRFIRLEKKVKQRGMGYKVSTLLTLEQTENIISGKCDWMAQSGDALLLELYSKMKMQGLRPKTIVDYTREPFLYPAGNVRVTLDYNIRTGILETDMLSADIATVPVTPGLFLLEVKYDHFLPDMIRDIVQQQYREESAFSKYEACRIFG